MPSDGFSPTLGSLLHHIERWVVRRLGSVTHERRVAANAESLFDLLQPLHRLGPTERRLLRMGAMVHDVGRAVDERTHPAQGMRMLLSDSVLPLIHADRRGLAYLTRYHRGDVPDLGRDRILSPADDHEALRVLLGILRVADLLDSRNLEPPRLVLSRRGRRVRILCGLHADSRKARRVYSRRKKLRLLERSLDLRVEVSLHAGRPLAEVA